VKAQLYQASSHASGQASRAVPWYRQWCPVVPVSRLMPSGRLQQGPVSSRASSLQASASRAVPVPSVSRSCTSASIVVPVPPVVSSCAVASQSCLVVPSCTVPPVVLRPSVRPPEPGHHRCSSWSCSSLSQKLIVLQSCRVGVVVVSEPVLPLVPPWLQADKVSAGRMAKTQSKSIQPKRILQIIRLHNCGSSLKRIPLQVLRLNMNYFSLRGDIECYT